MNSGQIKAAQRAHGARRGRGRPFGNRASQQNSSVSFKTLNGRKPPLSVFNKFNYFPPKWTFTEEQLKELRTDKPKRQEMLEEVLQTRGRWRRGKSVPTRRKKTRRKWQPHEEMVTACLLIV